MQKEDNIIKDSQEQSEETRTFDIREFLATCLNKWYWFVISIFVCLAAGVLYLMTTIPSYTRDAVLLIKVDSQGKSTYNDIGALGDFDLFKTWSNIPNEVAALQSPDLTQEVIERLKLQMNYYRDGFMRDEVLYGTKTPYIVEIFGIDKEDSAGFEITPAGNGKIILGDFRLNKDDYDGEVTTTIGKITNTPIGRIQVNLNENYKPGKDEEAGPAVIKVTRSGLTAATNSANSRLTINYEDETSSVLEMSFIDTSAQRATDFLNTLVDIYNENWVLDRNQVAISTSKFIDERLRLIEQELGEVDTDISSYKSSNLLPDINHSSSMFMDQAKDANQSILDINNRIQMAKYVRSYITGTNEFHTLPVNSGFEDHSLASQINTYNSQVNDRNHLVANSSQNNPAVKSLDAQLSDQRNAIISAIDYQLINLNNQLRTQQRLENEAINHIATNPEQAKHLLSIERQQKVKESLYLYLLQKREENELSQAFTAYNTRLVKAPRGLPTPTSPNTRNVLLIAFALGLIIPGAFLYTQQSLDTTVRGIQDIESLNIPIVGQIPMYRSHKMSNRLKKEKQEDKFRVFVKKGSRNVINEAFRVLRTNLRFIVKNDTGRGTVVMLTSFNPGSGKSFISINLAIAFAIRDAKTLVIDADLRRRSASKYIPSLEKGLSDYLAGNINNIDEIIGHSEQYPSLDIISAGTLPPNPTELLEDERFKTLIEDAKDRYEYIFIDCPPVDIVADTHIVNSFADRTLFVIKVGLLKRNMLANLKNLYDENKLNNIAIILNGIEMNAGKYGYNKSYYGSYYGYGSDTYYSEH